MFSKFRRSSLLVIPAVVLSLASFAPAAHADTNPVAGNIPINQPAICDGPKTVFTISSVIKSNRPSNVKSAYITGPGTLHYNKAISATVTTSSSASASADLNSIIASASVTAGKSLAKSRQWTDGFTYSVKVPAGKRRALQLFQGSRAFSVKKSILQSPCTYKVVYSGAAVNSPLKVREDEWKLVS